VNRPSLNLSAFGQISQANFLQIVRLLQDVSITAYAYFAGFFYSSANGQTAAQILGAEGVHSGMLRLACIQSSIPAIPSSIKPTDGFDITPSDPGNSATASKGSTSAGGFFPTQSPGTANESKSANGLVYYRDTSTVLSILYHNPNSGATGGGFFPQGFAGVFNSI
jgi:hypothetical protein